MLLINFGLFGRKLKSIIYAEIKRRIMEEVCVLKTCGRISLVLSTLTTNSLMLLF